jgi:hypothetical protein
MVTCTAGEGGKWEERLIEEVAVVVVLALLWLTFVDK